MPIMTFQEAIADSEQFSKRHLLLGNGFSISCRADIFHYGSLFEQADFTGMPQVRRVFDRLDTRDFEVAIKSLESAAQLIPIYEEHATAISDSMLDHAHQLKEILVSTISNNHPAIPLDIPDEQFWACRAFLNHFIGSEQPKKGYVFTLNYDLLLYWTLMHGDHPFEEQLTLDTSDGFGNDENHPEADYVIWRGESNSGKQNIHFLHGALHLLDTPAGLRKYTWVRNGLRLIDQIRAAIAENKYPLFVAEGTSAKKESKIRHNAYLYQCQKVLSANVATGTHCFFIFGHSLAASDDHIFRKFERGKCRKMYISLYGDPESDLNREIINRARNIQALRGARHPLDIAYYDAESANVWGNYEAT